MRRGDSGCMSGERKRYEDAERRGALRAWRLSGESAQAFSARTGISKSNLWRWAQRYGTAGADASVAPPKAGAHGGFAVVDIVEDADARRAEPTIPALMCELDGPRGLRLRVYRGADASALALLVDAVRGGSRC